MPTPPEHRPERLDQLLGRDRGVPARDANGVDRPYGPNAYVQLRGPAGPGRLARGQERQHGVFMGAAPPRQGPLRKERAQPPAGALRPHDDVAFPDRRRARTGLQPAVALGGSGVSGHLLRLALGRTRTCAHGSGEHADDILDYGSDLQGSDTDHVISTRSHAPHTRGRGARGHLRLLRPGRTRRREGLQHLGGVAARYSGRTGGTLANLAVPPICPGQSSNRTVGHISRLASSGAMG